MEIIRRIFGRPRLPAAARLGACTLCQLDCADCYMRKGDHCGIGAGYLSFANFARFVETNPFVKTIELSNGGEMFLNPDLVKIMEHAHRKKILLTAIGGVNFNDVPDLTLEALVRYKFGEIAVSIDGVDQETYAQYRRGGDFEKVIANVRRVNKYKVDYESEAPKLNWNYIIFAHNSTREHLRRAKKMAGLLGMEIFFKKDWSWYWPDDLDMVREETGLVYSKEDGREFAHGAGRWMPCADLWRAPQVNWDGRFLGCECNAYRDFGIDVFKAGLAAALGSNIVRDTKKMLMGGRECRESPCFTCKFYTRMAKHGNFITKAEVA